jgi:hypothetical protein
MGTLPDMRPRAMARINKSSRPVETIIILTKTDCFATAILSFEPVIEATPIW